MMKTKEKTMKKNEHSEDYIRIKLEAEQKWPEWKIKEYNTYFAVSKRATKIIVSEDN